MDRRKKLQGESSVYNSTAINSALETSQSTHNVLSYKFGKSDWGSKITRVGIWTQRNGIVFQNKRHYYLHYLNH